MGVVTVTTAPVMNQFSHERFYVQLYWPFEQYIQILKDDRRRMQRMEFPQRRECCYARAGVADACEI